MYCQDERFGPGILLYQKFQSADVGLWLSEDLIRLLYPHPKLSIDIHITEKKTSTLPSTRSSAWYSPEEFFLNLTDFHFLLHKKSPLRLFQQISDEKSFLTRFLSEHTESVNEALLGKRNEFEAYLSSIDENLSKLNNQITNISSPNQTYEQQKLYDYLNKFWPLKQRASFPIDDILSSEHFFLRKSLYFHLICRYSFFISKSRSIRKCLAKSFRIILLRLRKRCSSSSNATSCLRRCL